jgi:ribosomal-protein-alanine N-acetyltransferase
MPIEFRRVLPVMRIFDVQKAREFYLDYLGFEIDWEHRFEEGLPLYMQVSRGELTLHLSEHHGDGSPGAHVYIQMSGLTDLHRELMAKSYGYLRPGLQKTPWNTTEMRLTDPFGNRLRLAEPD